MASAMLASWSWLTKFGPQHVVFFILLVLLIVFLVWYRRKQF